MKRVALLGMTGVGKTTFMKALSVLGKHFGLPEEPIPTMYFEKYRVKIGNLLLIVIDTPGHLLVSPKDFKRIFKKIKEVDLVLFFVDITRNETYNGELFKVLGNYIHPQNVIVIVNKMDLVNYDLNAVNDVFLSIRRVNFNPAAVIPISAKTTYNIYPVLKAIADAIGAKIPMVFPILAVRILEDDITIAEYTRRDLPEDIVNFIRKAVVTRDINIGIDLITAFWSAIKKLLSSYSAQLGGNFMLETEIGKIAIVSKQIRDKEITGLFVLSRELVAPFIALKPKLQQILLRIYRITERKPYVTLDENVLIKAILGGL